MKYTDRIEISYDLTDGVPVKFGSEDFSLRISFHRNKTFPEQSRTFSFFRGISYRYWSSEESSGDGAQEDFYSYKRHFLSIIPFGFKFQGKGENFKPFMYVGAGVAVWSELAHFVYDHSDSADRTTMGGFFTVNLGVGVKIRVASHYFIAEVTPAVIEGGLFANIGYSF